MIKHLRRRLITVLTTLLALVMFTVLVAINLLNYSSNISQSRRYLKHQIAALGVDAFCDIDDEVSIPGDYEYCTVLLKRNQEPSILVNELTKHSDREMLEYARKAAANVRKRGSTFSLVYVKEPHGNHEVVIFMDNRYALENSANLFYLSLVIAVVGIFVLLGISVLLSQWLTKPVEQNINAQKQFISDASHELKTPLTIISANVDLLEDEGKHSKQLTYIRSEASRMNTLVNQMLTLARMDNTAIPAAQSDFSLNRALKSIVLPFESVAYENQITLDCSLEEEITIYGNKDEIQQLISILVDNAIRHTSTDGFIRVNAQRQHRKAIIIVSNTGEPIPPEIQDKIFERFYRADESRSSQEERYGLGLSIASSITQKHHGKITVVCKEGWTSFIVTLPVSNH